MSEARFQRPRQIVARDIDELGHVNNLVWARFVVELATAHSDAVGLDIEAYRELGAWWIVHRQEIDYHAPAFEGDEILEQTWIGEMRGARSLRESRFLRPADGALLLSARTQWAYVDAVAQRPRRIHTRVLEAMPVLRP